MVLVCQVSVHPFLSVSSSEACASRNHFFIFFSLDFHELWRSMTSTCVFTEVKRQ